MRKVAGEHPFCVIKYTNSYIFHICFILFIFLSYLTFGFVYLSLSSADTHGIAKYASTYIRDTHTRAHTHTQKKSRKTGKKKVGKIKKNKEGGSGKKGRRGKERTKRKGGKRRRKMIENGGEREEKRKKKRKREGGGFRG